MTIFDTAQVFPDRPFYEPVKIYAGLLGQIGDIIMFTPTLRRIKQIFPNSFLTVPVSNKYREAGLLIEGLPYVDRVFVTEFYFERQCDITFSPWHMGWPVDMRGEDEVLEERNHDIVLQTRPRHKRMPWWDYGHQTEAFAHMVGVPGPIDPRGEIVVPSNTQIPENAVGRIVFHNDSTIDQTNAWPWEHAEQFINKVGADNVVILGKPGPLISGTIDLRGQTTLCEAAAIIAAAQCFVGINSGPMWIAGALQAPTVGIYGTTYLPSAAWSAIQPVNQYAHYLQAGGPTSEISADDVIQAIERVEALYRESLVSDKNSRPI